QAQSPRFAQPERASDSPGTVVGPRPSGPYATHETAHLPPFAVVQLPPPPPRTRYGSYPPALPVSSDEGSASAIVVGAASGYHALSIKGYSRAKLSFPNSKFIESRPFRVAGHTWSMKHYPNGDRPETGSYISVFLLLKDPVADAVVAQFVFSFIDEAGKQKPTHVGNATPCRFDANRWWGYKEFAETEGLQRSGRVKDDCLTIRCDIAVIGEARTEDTAVPGASFVVVPLPDWSLHFRALLQGGKGTDVRFLVGDETFAAHRCVLAARSPVFDALLFGAMKEGTSPQSCIRIDDMEPQVFQSLLHFIYADSLPETEGQAGDDESGAAMSQHLLEAADRYSMQRLKLICEDRLCRNIDVSTVATTLALAEQHHCQGLKEACYEFLKSSKTLDAAMETDGFQHLARSCPSAFSGLNLPPPPSAMSGAADPAAASTTSTIVATTASGSHVLKIDGYSRTKGLATGIHLRSCSFTVGGHSWHLAYLPKGDCAERADYISFFLVLEDAAGSGPVLAQFSISLLDRAGKPAPSYTKVGAMNQFAGPGAHWGFATFLRRDALEKSRHLKDDCFAVRCDVTVVTEFRAEDAASAAAAAAAAAATPAFVAVPPPDLQRHFGDLLRTGQGADVRFRVDGEDFAAHRCVLAVRSPVFQAELFGAMKEASAGGAHCCVVIQDMRADVFRNLLHFIYTDSLPEPAAEEPIKAERAEEEALMAQHLLVAADRYGMDRLKFICEDTLCRHVDVSTAATTLALAEQHHCQGLKEACFQFLKSSPEALDAVLAAEGFDHLTSSCPSLIKELMSRLAAQLLARQGGAPHRRFSAGNRSWYLEYFPNGSKRSAAAFISVYLHLDESAAAEAEPVKARVRFSLLDLDGEPVPSRLVARLHRFSANSPSFGCPYVIKREWLESSGHLKDDHFTIKCEVVVTEELRAEDRGLAASSASSASPLVVAVPPSDLHRDLGDLLASEEGADFKFEVAGETFRAHRCVLAARSAVFKAEVFGSMREGTSGAAIRVDDMDAQVFGALLHFVYTNELPDFQDMENQEDQASIMAQHLLVAADRYDLKRLKLICEDRLCGHIDTGSFGTILALAEQHGCRGLKEECFRFLMSSPSALSAVAATDGFDHLHRSCPSVFKDFVSKISVCVPSDVHGARKRQR
ncbi:LOW QUALITY PROTEIN: hypothetical protein U9M48_009230, partial [Paspalum notatum var. saurae]